MIQQSNQYYLAFSIDLVLRASKTAMDKFHKASSWIKNGSSVVTEADIEIQKMLKDEIFAKFPGHGFIGEENEDFVIGQNQYIWVADPIDGTGAFASGLPVWGISLALLKDGEPIVAVFYQPVSKELYHATIDSDAMLTLKPGEASEENLVIHVNPDKRIDKRSLFLVPSNFHLQYNCNFIGKTRSLGSIAAHQCVVARAGGIATIMKPKIWDIAASILILKQAGGVTLDIENAEEIKLKKYIKSPSIPWIIAASSVEMFEQIKDTLTHNLNTSGNLNISGK